MSFLQMFAELASTAAEAIGAHQAQQLEQTQPRRVIRRKEGCTPCAAMAQVDAARKQLGFGSNGSNAAKKK